MFRIDPSREKTYRAKGIKSVKILIYDTNHINPVSPENNTKVEQFLRDNKLHKVNRTLLNALYYIGKREAHDESKFTPVNLESFFTKVATDQEEYAQEAKNFLTFFKNLGVDEVVSPCKKISEFIFEDLITTMPQFYGLVVKTYEQAKGKYNKVTNEPKTAKTNWMIIGLIIGLIVMGAVVAIWAVSSGAFNHLLSTLPSIGPSLPGATGGSGKLTMQQIGTSYPTPKSLVDAIHAQAVSCSQLPDDAKHMVNDPVGGGVTGTCP